MGVEKDFREPRKDFVILTTGSAWPGGNLSQVLKQLLVLEATPENVSEIGSVLGVRSSATI